MLLLMFLTVTVELTPIMVTAYVTFKTNTIIVITVSWQVWDNNVYIVVILRIVF